MKDETRDKVIAGNCHDWIGVVDPPDFIITSPPYDEMRDYEGYSLDLHTLGSQLFRKAKDGCVCAVVIQDQTKDGAKSGTTFRLICDWMDSGWRLFETCIYRKHGKDGAWFSKRFRVDHEYIVLFLKGQRPAYFNKESLKIASIHGGKVMTGMGTRSKDGMVSKSVTKRINPTKCRGTVWDYLNAGDKDKLKRMHPATFPDKLAADLIECFCPPNGLVLDPLCGSGTSCVMAAKLGRQYTGIEISKKYQGIAEERLRQELQ